MTREQKMRELADMHGRCSLATRAWAWDEITRLQAIVDLVMEYDSNLIDSLRGRLQVSDD